jgi:hypothetical protein
MGWLVGESETAGSLREPTRGVIDGYQRQPSVRAWLAATVKFATSNPSIRSPSASKRRNFHLAVG